MWLNSSSSMFPKHLCLPYQETYLHWDSWPLVRYKGRNCTFLMTVCPALYFTDFTQFSLLWALAPSIWTTHSLMNLFLPSFLSPLFSLEINHTYPNLTCPSKTCSFDTLSMNNSLVTKCRTPQSHCNNYAPLEWPCMLSAFLPVFFFSI